MNTEIREGTDLWDAKSSMQSALDRGPKSENPTSHLRICIFEPMLY